MYNLRENFNVQLFFYPFLGKSTPFLKKKHSSYFFYLIKFLGKFLGKGYFQSEK